jgi:hypothetical protein
MKEIVIGSNNFRKFVTDPVIDGEQKKRGLIPRDYSTHPRGCYPSIEAVDIPLIPRAEWSDRIKDKVAARSQNSDVKKAKNVPIQDQNGKGYCWAHSTTGAVMTFRAIMNEPTVSLSAYSVACVIKHFADQGGWGAESADFVTQRGIVPEELWPLRSMSQGNDTPAAWEKAALYKIAAAWTDLQAAQYDRNMTFDQYATLWLSNCSTIDDHNWWGHSVEGCDLVEGASLRDEMRHEDSGKLLTLQEFDRVWCDDPAAMDDAGNGYGGRIANSWGTTWSDGGFGILAGSKAVPDGGLGLRSVRAA